MNRCNPIKFLICLRSFLLPFGSALAIAITLFASGVRGAEVGSGVLSGTVNNTATHNLLEGALVAIPALSRSVFTDNSGRYVLADLPAGTYEVVVTYIGLDEARQTVAISAGQRLARDFDLTTGIYKLEAFRVTGEREGNAAMITEKRNADNVKDVIAMDSFGYARTHQAPRRSPRDCQHAGP